MAKGIYLVRCKMANVYLIESGQQLIILDAATVGFAERILDAVGRTGKRPEDVSTIVITHAHPDHFGSAAELKRRTGAVVAAHPVEIPFLEGREPIKDVPHWLVEGPISRVTGLITGDYRAPAVKVDRSLQDGDQVDGWVVIHTPGHTPGCLSLYSPGRKTLIAGNWILSGQLASMGWSRVFGAEARSAPSLVVQSLRRLARLDFETLLCSHFDLKTFPYIARRLKGQRYW